MRFSPWTVPFLAIAAAAAAFIAYTGRAMPALVASHFVASGAANGFMPRPVYLTLILVVCVGLPVALAFATGAAVGRPSARINLPNRDYWLAPERRGATVARLRTGILQFNVLLIVFLAYAHWLVVRANQVQPPMLPARHMIAGLLAFCAALIVWMRRFARGFGKSERTAGTLRRG